MQFSFVTIYVKNLEQSLSFYGDILGFKPVRRFSPGPGMNIVFLQGDGEAQIELIEGGAEEAGKAPPNLTLGFYTNSMESVQKMLLDNNIPVKRGPTQVGSGAILLFIEDPDGIEIEFVQDPHHTL